MSDVLCVIPARMASSRFPGKPLAKFLGLELVLHIYARCRLSKRIGRTVVATCDDAIRRTCEAYGAEVVMTADTHAGCVDRTDEAVDKIGDDLAVDSMVLMVQGDEVLFGPDMADKIIEAYGDGSVPVVNLASPIVNAADHVDPNCVKAVAAPDGRALYFSRAAIPSPSRSETVPMLQQTGVIGFSKQFLKTFGELERTPLEMVEHIDMMRTLEHGYPIRLVIADRPTLGVDTPADRDRVEDILRTDPWTPAYLEDHT